jgi:hypothetical protein
MWTHAHLTDAMAAVAIAPPPTPFPVVTWRVDTVILVVLGFALIPVAMGRWLPERVESGLLILAYLAYLFVKAIVARAMSA